MNKKNHSIRETKKITDYAMKQIDIYARQINFDASRIKSGLSLTYPEYKQIFEDEFTKAIQNNSSNKDFLQHLQSFFQFLDNCYTYKNSYNFIMKFSKISSLVIPPYGFAEVSDINYDICGDFFVDFELASGYAPISLKFLKADYLIHIPSLDKEVQPYVLALQTLLEDRVIHTLWSALFIKELYPRVFAEPQDNKGCTSCKVKNIKHYSCVAKDASTGIDVCLVGKNLLPNCNTLESKQPYLDVHSMLCVVTHICKMFAHRNTVTRKNSPLRKTYEKASVHVAKAYQDKTEIILPLELYAKKEQKEKREYQGGHHNSPVEHIRQAHYRNYYDSQGKVVKTIEVRSSIVSKGNNKAVYKI